MSFQLREYQEKAVSKIVWSTQLSGHDLCVMATGSGKSLVLAEVANRLGKEVLILAPSKEITEQNISKMRHYAPFQEIGIYSASMKSKTIRKYTFATIGSIYKKAAHFAHIGLILIDECHLVDLKNLQGMYMTFITAVNANRARLDLPPVKIIGLSATPYRNVQGYHTDKDSGQLYATVTLKLLNRMKANAKTECFWNRILINVSIGDLIEQGYLCPLEYENRTFITQDDMKLNKSETDFDLDDFAIKLGSRQEQILGNILGCETKYKSVLVFCTSVSLANKYASAIPGAASVNAKTPDHERDQIIRDFKSGKIQTVFNVSCLTTGFDHPELDCIVLLRPTRSLALFAQMLGRGCRTSPGKKSCMIVDWTNTVEQLGKIETIHIRKEQFPEFKHPMWEIFSTTANGEERWHNRPLYKFKISKSSKDKSFFMAKAMDAKKNSGRLF